MIERDGTDQGRKVDQNGGLGQQRVDEPGPGPDQLAQPGSAGGPGTGSGDDGSGPAEPQRGAARPGAALER